MTNFALMKKPAAFQRRGIVEGFFGPPWSMAHRGAVFEFGAARGMNTYLYAPKDDPYHRARWRDPYPRARWRELVRLIAKARENSIAFVYGFHPGQGLSFSSRRPIQILLKKAQLFYDEGVRTFAVLFDDIPSKLTHECDRLAYKNSLARAEGSWLAEIQAHQQASWSDVEWWICPSYYSEDPLLARTFGEFEPDFLETMAERLPGNVACFWTGPAVVAREITLKHVRHVAKKIRRPLLIWDNYPVNDLSMADELHIGPLVGRDPRLADIAYGYLNNPLLQEDLSFLPLATCFEYAKNPRAYRPERSWRKIIEGRFGAAAISAWRTLRRFCEISRQVKTSKANVRLSPQERARLGDALAYLCAQRNQKWAREINPWQVKIENALKTGKVGLS
jgi:hyaluronoglucosaminidase